MKNYYRVVLGRKHVFAEEAHKGNFIGADFLPNKNLTGHLPDNLRDFNKEFIPLYQERLPNKSKLAAGFAGGMLWTVTKEIQVGDIVLCPDGKGSYYVGEVTGNYEYHKGEVLPHRRSVRWFSEELRRDELSEPLRNSTGTPGTVRDLSKHAAEIEGLIGGNRPPSIIATDATIEDPSVFALEKHLEDFLIENWRSTELGKQYDIFEEEGEIVGKQYPSDTGPIDILAISKNKNELVVIELKKGRASDSVVGQIQRYMGYVKEELAEDNQTVRGIIIAFEDDIKIKRALSVATNIDFYSYKIQFKLQKH